MMIIIGDIASLGAEGNSYEPEALHSNIEALEARIHHGLDALDSEPEVSLE